MNELILIHLSVLVSPLVDALKEFVAMFNPSSLIESFTRLTATATLCLAATITATASATNVPFYDVNWAVGSPGTNQLEWDNDFGTLGQQQLLPIPGPPNPDNSLTKASSNVAGSSMTILNNRGPLAVIQPPFGGAPQVFPYPQKSAGTSFLYAGFGETWARFDLDLIVDTAVAPSASGFTTVVLQILWDTSIPDAILATLPPGSENVEIPQITASTAIPNQPASPLVEQSSFLPDNLGVAWYQYTFAGELPTLGFRIESQAPNVHANILGIRVDTIHTQGGSPILTTTPIPTPNAAVLGLAGLAMMLRQRR